MRCEEKLWPLDSDTHIESDPSFEKPGERRIFAIAPRARAVGPDGRVLRRILIFDNHPEGPSFALQFCRVCK
jgi:hypothetical protein